ncbi:hypothetical protein ABK040_011794 [Willaertia magna]
MPNPTSTLKALVHNILNMKYTNLGNSGLTVSRLCFGCMSFGSKQWQDWVLEEEESKQILKRAWDLGINFFDTADVYSNGESERILGNFIKENKIEREEIVIATKVWGPVDKSGKQPYFDLTGLKPNTFGLSRKHIMEAVDQSLKRLQTDYIDLYIIHRWDNKTPIEETMETLHQLVQQGKVRYIGASTMYAWQFAKAQRIAEQKGWTKFISMQNLYNLVYREEEREMIPLCKDLGVTNTPWSPIARGVLAKAEEIIKEHESNNEATATLTTTTRANTDYYSIEIKKGLTNGDLEVLKRVVELSKKKNCTPAQLSIAWLLHKPNVSSPVIGVTKIENVDVNVAAVDIELSVEEIKYLDEPYVPKALFGGFQ